jgi:hypothetical protein
MNGCCNDGRFLVIENEGVVKNMNHEAVREPVNLEAPGPTCMVDVLNPSLRITIRRSAFCSGFEREAVKMPLVSPVSRAPYALIAMIGVVVFLLLVLLMYRAAPSPSTGKR